MRILIEVMHGLGDTVCALPMIKIVREKYSKAHITVLTKFEAGKEILLASRIQIDEILVLDVYSDALATIKALLKLRERHFDVGISCAITPIQKAKWFMRIVKPLKWYALQKKGVDFNSLGDKYHFVEANLLAVQDLCGTVSEKQYPRLYVDAEILQNIMEKFHVINNIDDKVVGICIGKGDYSFKNRMLCRGKVYTRGWGTQNMINLIDILQKLPIKIFLLGGTAEKPIVNLIRQKMGDCDNVIDFVGKTTIPESMAVASLCKCVVGVDTGMQHIAAAIGTPTMSIFGPTNPKTHGAYAENSHFVVMNNSCDLQYCYGSKMYIQCKNRVCLKAISIAMVVEQIKYIMEL